MFVKWCILLLSLLSYLSQTRLLKAHLLFLDSSPSITFKSKFRNNDILLTNQTLSLINSLNTSQYQSHHSLPQVNIAYQGRLQSATYPLGHQHFIYVVTSAVQPTDINKAIEDEQSRLYDLLLLPKQLEGSTHSMGRFNKDEVCYYTQRLPTHSQLKQTLIDCFSDDYEALAAQHPLPEPIPPPISFEHLLPILGLCSTLSLTALFLKWLYFRSILSRSSAI